jgi:DNA-binding NarL/FixJ family response regulator
MKIAIIEDDARLRASLRAVFEHAQGFCVEATFAEADSALAAAQAGPGWDLVLMDIGLPGMDGVEATRRIKRILPDVAVVMITVYEDPSIVIEAICAGADGYLLKRSSASELVEEVRHIGRGGAPLTPRVA